MVNPNEGLFLNREHAAGLLSERLKHLKGSDAVVVAIPHGGVPVGYHLSRHLGLSLLPMGCKALNHPAMPDSTIGSVSEVEVVLHEEGQDIPQDYIYHQIRAVQGSLKCENEKCHGSSLQLSLANKTVIVVDDLLTNADAILACLKAIRKQQPVKVVMAIPVASSQALRILHKEVDEIVCLVEAPEDRQAGSSYKDFSRVTEKEACDLIDQAHRADSQTRHHPVIA